MYRPVGLYRVPTPGGVPRDDLIEIKIQIYDCTVIDTGLKYTGLRPKSI